MALHTTRRSFMAMAGLASSGLILPARLRAAETAPDAAIRAMMDDWVNTKRVPGVVAGFARGLEPTRFMATGLQGFGAAPAMTIDSLFRAYSMTKPVTGMAAMILIEEGKLGLDQNIADFIPGFANPRVMTNPQASLDSRPATGPITVRHLLTHTAGLGYSIVTKGPLLKAYTRLGLNPAQVTRKRIPFSSRVPTAPSLAEFADRLATLPLIADPGTVWSYSVSLDLLGRVIEVASGMPFETFLQSRIFTPLGMNDTVFQVQGAAIERLTTCYIARKDKPLAIDPAEKSIYLDKPPFPFGGAGLVTSPRDWDRFLLMLMGEGAIGDTRIMASSTARLAMSNLVPPGTRMESYVKGQGFGAGGRVTIAPSPDGEGLGSFGWGGAASTTGWVDRTKQVRASGWVQLLTFGGPQRFPIDFAKAVYSA